MLLLYYDMTTLLELDYCERWCILQSIILCDELENISFPLSFYLYIQNKINWAAKLVVPHAISRYPM